MNTDDKLLISKLDEMLSLFIGPPIGEYKHLLESMDYSVSAGGKRIRPMLCMKFAQACGCDPLIAIYPACAVEFIQTYSLIHDDLPCMDDDDMRRGKPSNHVVFGEDTALLAGDALQSLAFESLLCDKSISLIGYERAAKCAKVLAELIGAKGMVGGQVVDLWLEKEVGDEATIVLMHTLKTAALIKAACLMGCICACASEEQLQAAAVFAECIGLQFQIVDDILDVTSTTDILGKPVYSDVENNKSNLVSLFGIDECKKRAQELTQKAIDALKAFDSDTSWLEDFALKLLNRNK